jgi:hypothetical protein
MFTQAIKRNKIYLEYKMKIRRLKDFRISVIMISIILGCIFWIVRVETRASALESRVAEYHKMLDQNKDELQNLNSFVRTIEKSKVYMDMTINGISLITEESALWLEHNNRLLLSNSKGPIQLENNNGNITLFQKEIDIRVHDRKYPLRLSAGPNSSLTFEDDIVNLHGLKELTLSTGYVPNNNKIKIAPDMVTLEAFNAKISIDKTGNIWFETDKQINFSAKGEIHISSENEVNLYGSRINFNEF